MLKESKTQRLSELVNFDVKTNLFWESAVALTLAAEQGKFVFN